jgi:hypothetical protein
MVHKFLNLCSDWPVQLQSHCPAQFLVSRLPRFSCSPFFFSIAMFKHKSKGVNRFAAAAEAASTGRSVFSDNGQHYNLQTDYPFRLNFYLKPPPSEITIEEFEKFALDRLQGKRKKNCQYNASLRY